MRSATTHVANNTYLAPFRPEPRHRGLSQTRSLRDFGLRARTIAKFVCVVGCEIAKSFRQDGAQLIETLEPDERQHFFEDLLSTVSHSVRYTHQSHTSTGGPREVPVTPGASLPESLICNLIAQ